MDDDTRDDWKLPFADLFRPLTPDEETRLTESIKRHGGVKYPVMLYDSPKWGTDCVIDGVNRLRIGTGFGLTVPTVKLAGLTDDEAWELAVSLNADRRQLTAEDYMRISPERAARIKRATTARIGGDSIRVIAEREGVSESQIRQDLSKAAPTAQGGAQLGGVNCIGGDTVEPAKPQPAPDDTFSLVDQGEEPDPEPESKPPATVKPASGKVVGKDGRTRTATPKKPAAKKEKTAAEPAPPASPPPAADPADKPRDQLGRVLPKHLIPIFDKRSECRAASADLGRAFSKLKAIDADETVGGFLKRRPQIKTDIAGVAGVIRTRLAPYAVCPACEGDGAKGECPSCGGKGWLTRHEFGALHELLRDKARSFRPGDSWEGDDPVPDGCECEDAPDPQRHCVSPAADAAGNPVPKHLRDLFHGDFLFDTLRDLASIARQLDDAKSWLHWLEPETHRHAKLLIECVEKAVPHEVCVVCEGKGCGQCMMSGYHPEWSCASGRNKPVEKPAKKGKKKGAA